MGRLAIVLTVSAWIAYTSFTIFQQFIEGRADSARLVIEAIVYMFVVTALTASAMAYLITRIGFFYRSRVHRRAPRAAIDDFFEQTIPTVTVLVPSYQEDERVVRTTLLSAALQEHPYLRIVLLVDDPPEPTSAHAREILQQSRDLPGRIQDLLAGPCARFQDALDAFEQSQGGDTQPTVDDVLAVAADYRYAVAWLRDLAAAQEIVDHSDTFFADHVVGALADDLEIIADALEPPPPREPPSRGRRMRQLHRRLVATFRAELSSFERKQYVSLSARAEQGHEPEQLHRAHGRQLQGGRHADGHRPRGVRPPPATLTVPDPDYVLTLDADSVLLPEYTVRILHLMEQSAHADVGVAQTPVQLLSRLGDAHRAHRRGDHRSAAHRPSGHDPLRRDLLGRGQRHPAQAGPRGHRRDRPRGRLGDPPLHPGPHGHRGHRVDHRPRRPRLDAAQLPRAAGLHRDAARLRLAVHPAPPLGQRRPAHPVEAAQAVEGPQGPRRARTASARCSCGSTTWRRSSGRRSAC